MVEQKENLPENEALCPDCRGRGRKLRKANYFGKLITEHCWTCKGTGFIKVCNT